MADPRYGSEVAPSEPVQDMTQIDTLVGSVHDRTDSPSEFTGGDTGTGLGGQAEQPPEGGTMYDRIGF